MARYRLAQLINIEKLNQVLDDIFKISSIPTGIMDVDSMKSKINGVDNDCKDFRSLCNISIQNLLQKFNNGDEFAISRCKKGLNVLGVPIKLENENIAVLFHCQFYLSKNHIPDNNEMPVIDEERLKTITGFLLHFAEFITITCAARHKELEVNTKLDLMIQKETVELLKTNADLENQIKERKLAEVKLRNSEEKFRSIFEQTSIGIITFTTRFRLINCNLAINTMLGYTPEEFEQKKVRNLLVEEDIEIVRNHLTDLISKKIDNFRLETRFYKKDKSILWGRITVSIISHQQADSPDFIVMMMEDITARKIAEKDLTESEERFRSLFENAPEAVYLFDPENYKILLANKYTKDFFGYTDQELSEMTIHQLIASSRHSVNQKIKQVLQNGQAYVVERKYRKKGGAVVDVDVVAAKNYYKGKDCVLAFVRDITERKRYETEIKKALERERELNQLKSNFVSTVSHEFKTPMAIILSSVQLLERFSNKWSEEKKIKLYQKIYKAVMQTNGLINNVLLIGRDQSGKLEYKPNIFDFEDFCHQIVDETSIIFGSEVKIETNIDTNVGEIEIDTNLLRHIFTNLISNAIKYSPENKDILFKTELVDGSFISIVISDKGIGISENDLKNIFEPFHRAENVDQIQGTGLGMSIVKRCVDLHGGTINVDSKLGIGTNVEVVIEVKKKG